MIARQARKDKENAEYWAAMEKVLGEAIDPAIKEADRIYEEGRQQSQQLNTLKTKYRTAWQETLGRMDILRKHVSDNGGVVISRANSIENRLTKLLQYLAAQFGEEGWSRFMAHDGPRWARIAVSGHSQGGGEAAMIA